jgi:spore germination protein GerM
MRTIAALVVVALASAGCSHRQTPPSSPQIAVYFCRAGTDTLVATPFTVDPQLTDAQLETLLVDQLLAGPANTHSNVVLFPAGTKAAVSVAAGAVTIDLSGPLAKQFRGGASDEVALFKSLTYTATSVAGVQSVQIRIAGRVVPTLPGGEFEIDEPLTRETFSQ